MKLNAKALMLLLSAGVIFSLSGCNDSDSTPVTITTPPTTTPPATEPPATEPAAGELGYQTTLPDGSLEYVDYTGNTRIAPPSAADAEYHTGMGYGNTLFDSADNKCMNCHNELYDTWKNSMHGKSWTDPIFQSKFQDFLRTHINKIGEDKSGSGTVPNNGIEYTEAMFPKVAQTCIKCHAPGAYYAGDFSAKLELVSENADTDALNAAKIDIQSNLAPAYDATQPATVVAVSHTTGKLYKATYQIGHEANLEGINCAFCHSIETPRLMKADGMDNGEYKLANTMRVGPHGPVKNNIGDILTYDVNASSRDMNHFFRLWGPEKYAAYHATPKGGDAGTFDEGKSKDGRYTMTSKNIHDENNTHFTGGPFYGPFGISGKSNENSDDTTDRKALINPHFDKDNNNHFGESGKGLCLSCHQRSAGASLSGSPSTNFMELCSTQIAVSTNGPLGQDNGSEDTLSSPKCQKCHMERIEGDLLHQWARPDLDFDAATFKAAVGYDLTPELDNNVSTSVLPEGEAPERDGWLNSHAFLGASKTGHKTSATAKIQSGFDSTLATTVENDTLRVTTTLKNLTAHMFPGAHPMRRVLTRVIVTDGTGTIIPSSTRSGNSTFTDIENSVQPLQGKVLHSSTAAPVPVNENGSANLSFPGKTADLDGSTVSSQKFDGTVITILGTDYTIQDQIINQAGKTEGNVTNAAIVDSMDNTNFTRIYGHETGKEYNNVFVVRPGFDSNMVGGDNRLSPNETETYTLTYDILGKTGVKVEYRVYYMQKGANGKFIADPETGFLNQAVSDEKKLLVTEVANHSETL